MSDLEKRLAGQFDSLRGRGLERHLLELCPLAGSRLAYRGREYLNLASNDYLGLAGNMDLVAGFYDGIHQTNLLARFAPGATASRLMTGNRPVNRELEDELSLLYAPASALVFNSGYHANIGILPTLAQKGDLMLADKLCHASLIDGMRLSRAKVIRYPHLDYERLDTLLAVEREKYGQVFIVTESIFSMDGDAADLVCLARLKEKYRAVLYVDEAHGVGVRGAKGLGLAEEQGVRTKVDLLVGTFGKAWAGQGAFVICSGIVRDYLINSARSLIFTTGLPPVTLAWLVFILPNITTMDKERRHVRELADDLRQNLMQHGLETRGGSNIVPVLIGDADRAVQIAEDLREHGFWITAVRPPTVPAGTSRLRLSLTAAMRKKDLVPLPKLIVRAMEKNR